MPGLREVLRQRRPNAATRPPSAPVHCERAEQAIREQVGSPVPREPSLDRRRAVHERLQQIAADQGHGMGSLSSSDLRHAPWVLFEPFGDDPDAVPLAARDGVLQSYLQELNERGKASAIAALIYCVLLFYPQTLSRFEQLCDFIASHLVARSGGPRIARWRGCLDDCGLLTADAPTRLAARLANADRPPDAVLEDCCLKGMLATGGLARAAYRQFIAAVSEQLRRGHATPALVERLLDISRGRDDAKALRFPPERVRLADALLLPFADGNPGVAVAEPIKAFLLELLGDPRLTGARRWNGIDARARQVMLGWLVTETLEDFFRLLEYAARTDATARRHWGARKTFWTRYLRQGVIADAWVALGPNARSEGRDMLSGAGQTYAALRRGSGVQANHSAIILRIGGLVITEWSHSGKFRAWRSDDPHSPPLYRSAYSRSDLVSGADAEIAHYSGWQARIADLIHDRTGVSP